MSKSHVAADLLRAAACCSSLRLAVLPEIAAFAEGTKPSLRFVVSPQDAARLGTAAMGIGLPVRTRRVFLVSKRNGWSEIVHHRTKKAQELIVITRDAGAGRLLDAELTAPGEAGILLGYPECCVRGSSAGETDPDLWALRLLQGAEGLVDARLNRFAAEWGGIGVIGELFPCSLRCQAASRYAQTLYDSLISLGLHKLAEVAKSDALAPVNVSKQGRISKANSKASLEFYW